MSSGIACNLTLQPVSSVPGVKPALNPAAPIQSIPVPDRRFTHMNVDIGSPLLTLLKGFSYLSNMVDRSTR